MRNTSFSLTAGKRNSVLYRFDVLSTRACRAYERSAEELLSLTSALKEAGIDVGGLQGEVNTENHDAVLKMIAARVEFQSLQAAVRNWKGFYENMEEEEREWYSYCDLLPSDSDDEPMYGGVSDDWEEYLDTIRYD